MRLFFEVWHFPGNCGISVGTTPVMKPIGFSLFKKIDMQATSQYGKY